MSTRYWPDNMIPWDLLYLTQCVPGLFSRACGTNLATGMTHVSLKTCRRHGRNENPSYTCYHASPLPRPYAPAISEQMVVSRQIHVFSDASEWVYGSVSYLRTEDVQGRVYLAFHSPPRALRCADCCSIG